jgi:predicted dehydrogenase
LAIDLSRTGALGGVQHFSLENLASAENLPADHWFWDPQASGGIHVEHGVHFIDLCLALIDGDPDVVTGTAHRRPDGRVDRVSALVGFGDRAAASFYHSFNRAADTEQTTIRLAFERGHVTLHGWIPTSLEMDGRVSRDVASTLRDLFGDGLRTSDPGRVDPAEVSVEALATAPDRQGAYRTAVRSGMSDLVAAIGGTRPPEVTPDDGLRSLEIAIRASG